MARLEQEDLSRWERYYEGLEDAYLFPNEYVVRSFLGSYPTLSLNHDYKGKKICDVGCGDGRNLTALHRLGFSLFATEISAKICAITKAKLLASADHIAADIRPGTNERLPFADDFFDFLLSWNSCYYMRDAESNIEDHVAEYARVAKPGAYLVASVPGPGCFSLIGAEDLGRNLIRIRTESKWNMLNGTIYHRFRSFDDIESIFGAHFTNFRRCTIKDDCFGLPLEYLVFVCERRP